MYCEPLLGGCGKQSLGSLVALAVIWSPGIKSIKGIWNLLPESSSVNTGALTHPTITLPVEAYFVIHRADDMVYFFCLRLGAGGWNGLLAAWWVCFHSRATLVEASATTKMGSPVVEKISQPLPTTVSMKALSPPLATVVSSATLQVGHPAAVTKLPTDWVSELKLPFTTPPAICSTSGTGFKELTTVFPLGTHAHAPKKHALYCPSGQASAVLWRPRKPVIPINTATTSCRTLNDFTLFLQ